MICEKDLREYERECIENAALPQQADQIRHTNHGGEAAVDYNGTTHLRLDEVLQDIRQVHAEAQSGVFTDHSGEEHVVNDPELRQLIFVAMCENWLGWCAHNQNRMDDAQTHFTKYEEAMREIYSDRFSADQGTAWAILD
jgi:hypothetical protein